MMSYEPYAHLPMSELLEVFNGSCRALLRRIGRSNFSTILCSEDYDLNPYANTWWYENRKAQKEEPLHMPRRGVPLTTLKIGQEARILSIHFGPGTMVNLTLEDYNKMKIDTGRSGLYEKLLRAAPYVKYGKNWIAMTTKGVMVYWLKNGVTPVYY